MAESIKDAYDKTVKEMQKDPRLQQLIDVVDALPKTIFYIKYGQQYVYKGNVIASHKHENRDDTYYVIKLDATYENPFSMVKKTTGEDNEVFDTFAEAKSALLMRYTAQMGTLSANINSILTLKE